MSTFLTDFEVDPKVATQTVFDVFNNLTDWQLAKMVIAAGVVPHERKKTRIEQAMIIWFGGSVPCLITMARLVS